MAVFASVLRPGVVLFLLTSILGFSQMGRVPTGGYPEGGSSAPGRSGTRTPSSVPGGKQQGNPKDKTPNEVLPTFAGTVKSVTRKSLIIEGEESNALEFYCSRKTVFYDGTKKIKYSSLKAGDRVAIEAKRVTIGPLDAVNVRLSHEKQEPR